MNESSKLRPGLDHTGVTVSFYCHDGRGNYLFHKRSVNCRDEHGRWDCGGGSVHFGETLEAALKREIMEEYGVAPEAYEYLGFREVFRNAEGQDTHWLAFHFKVRIPRDKVVNGEPHKIDAMDWFTLDALPEPLHSQIRPELEKYGAELR